MSQSESETSSQPPYRVIKPGETAKQKKAVPKKPQLAKQRVKISTRVSTTPFKSSRPGSKVTSSKAVNANGNSVCYEIAAEVDLGTAVFEPSKELTELKMAHVHKEMENLVKSMGLVNIQDSHDGPTVNQQPGKRFTLFKEASKIPTTAEKTATESTAKTAEKASAKTTTLPGSTGKTGREHLQRQCNKNARKAPKSASS